MSESMRRVPRGDAPVLAWPLVCGSAVAERTRAVEFASGTLRIEVSDLGWKRELEALAPRYLATMNQYVGPAVTWLEFVVRDERMAGIARR